MSQKPIGTTTIDLLQKPLRASRAQVQKTPYATDLIIATKLPTKTMMPASTLPEKDRFLILDVLKKPKRASQA
ncbi:MAG: hypothetical protein LBB21_02405 [Holosporaceae bacterium]|nr:hypothetical protein [Holosporaceae bacterium]